MARSTSSSSTLLVVIILVITFPIWFAIGGAIFGLIVGLFGVIIGIFGGLLGLLVGLIALPCELIFGDNIWGGHTNFHPSFFHTNNGFVILLLIGIAIMIIQKRKAAKV